MPHSSGGGSHGGGSHGGSYGGSGSGGGPARHSSRHYFAGCRTYVYYRHGHPYYVYGNYDMTTSSKGSNLVALLVVIIMMVAFAYAIFSTVRNPKPIQNTEDNSILIVDDLNTLGTSKADLENEFIEFKEQTGITPYFLSVYNESWQGYYAYLENYAYDYYVNHIGNDETYWLIVYSVPQNPDIAYVNWYFEGMQGDNTDDILNEPKLDTFNESLDKYLLQTSMYSAGEAFVKAFDELNTHVMTRDIEWGTLLPLCIIGVLLIFALFAVIKSTFFKGYKDEELAEVKTENAETPKTTKCEYCGGEYVVGAHKTCPHCGAGIFDE